MNTKPTIELKAIKVSAFASEETHCYEATLYVDGEKWGALSNEGRGGADRFYGVNGRGYDEIKALDERIKATFPKLDVSYMYGDGEKHEMDESLETVCGNLVNEHLVSADLKRLMGRKLVFTKPAQPGIFEVSLKQKGRTFSVEQVKVAMEARNPGIVALNSMPFPEALALYRANMGA